MLESPHRYCDQRCDQCPLRPSCPASVEPIVENAPPIVLDRAGLRTAALSHATATMAVLRAAVELGRVAPEVASAIEADAFAIAARVGRIVGIGGEEAIGHLLVLERLLHRVDGGILTIEGLLPPDPLRAQRERRWELGVKLAPQMRAIQPHHRAALRTLVARGAAPSPFASAPAMM